MTIVRPLTELEMYEAKSRALEARKAIAEERQGPRKRYHLQILVDPETDLLPIQAFTAGGLTWQGSTSTFDDQTGAEYRKPGSVQSATEAMLKRARERIDRYVIRWEGNGRRPKAYDTRLLAYTEARLCRDVREVPLERYLKTRELAEGEKVGGVEERPRAVLEEPKDDRDARTQARHAKARARGGRVEG